MNTVMNSHEDDSYLLIFIFHVPFQRGGDGLSVQPLSVCCRWDKSGGGGTASSTQVSVSATAVASLSICEHVTYQVI